MSWLHQSSSGTIPFRRQISAREVDLYLSTSEQFLGQWWCCLVSGFGGSSLRIRLLLRERHPSVRPKPLLPKEYPSMSRRVCVETNSYVTRNGKRCSETTPKSIKRFIKLDDYYTYKTLSQKTYGRFSVNCAPGGRNLLRTEPLRNDRSESIQFSFSQ